MLSRLKQYTFIAVVLGFFYFLLSNHFIFFSLTDYERLKKKELTFKNTFTSVQQPESVLREAELREAGVGEMMVRRGVLTAEKMQQIVSRIEAQQQ